MSCVLDTCCCCIELRTGCLFIGYLELVFNICETGYGLLIVMLGDAFMAAGENPDMQAEKATIMQWFGLTAEVLGIICLLFGLFPLTFTIVLLVGVHQNKRGHVKAYLIFNCIYLVLCVLDFFAIFAENIRHWKVITHIVVPILLNTYFMLVIRSHHLKMDDKRPQIYYTAPRLPALAYSSAPPIPYIVPNGNHKMFI